MATELWQSMKRGDECPVDFEATKSCRFDSFARSLEQRSVMFAVASKIQMDAGAIKNKTSGSHELLVANGVDEFIETTL